jgi:integrase
MGPHDFRLKFVIFTDGERVPILSDECGIPLWYPTLFVTTQVRNASKAPNTMLAVYSAIRIFLAWAESLGLSLEARFARKHFLTEAELESFRAYCQGRINSVHTPQQKFKANGKGKEAARANLQQAITGVSSATQYVRLTYVADYLEWLATRLVERDARHIESGTRADIQAMVKKLRLRRPQMGARSAISARRGLSEQAQKRLFELILPTASCNPFESEVRPRNSLLVMLLYHLGLRAGELLALKVSDFDFQRNEVVVARRHGDKDDPRRNQPVVKTMDRRIPLSNSLAKAVFDYVMNDRRKLPAAKHHAFLLVAHKAGPFCGQPLSTKGLDKVFRTICKVDPKMFPKLSPHILRHTANDRLSEKMDTNEVSAPQEEKMRSYIMGWKEGSGTAAIYTRRHIEKKAREVFLRLQVDKEAGTANE